MFKRPGGWPQGLTSGYPIEYVEEVVPEVGKGLRGTLYCQTAGIHFFVVHFDPHNFHKRQVEAKAVVERIAPLLKAGKAVIVLGDFNAHSAVDAEGLEKQTELLERWRIKEREKPGYHAFDNNGEVDYSVMQMFLEAGLVDPAENPPGTFPTRILSPDDDEEGHAAKVHRIDFILVDPGTARRVVKMSFPRDAALDTISDHYPVLLELAPQPE
jgi:endonuclease/exonuclease/phosphatase family metal-dependent hydrolase